MGGCTAVGLPGDRLTWPRPVARPAPATSLPRAHEVAPPPPLCDIPSGCCSFTGPWTLTRSSLRMLRRVAAFCRPLRPVLLLVSFPRSWSPVVGVPGLCWMWRDVPFVCQRRPIVGVLRMCWLLPGSFDCFCCPHPPPPPQTVVAQSSSPGSQLCATSPASAADDYGHLQVSHSCHAKAQRSTQRQKKGGGGGGGGTRWLVVGSVSLWRRPLASRP